MIDWEYSGSTPSITKNKDHVYVACEKCEKRRLILYQVAKRNTVHLCMSCAKSTGEHKTNQIVEHTCCVCGVKKNQKFRPDRFNSWRCHKCGMKRAHELNKFNIDGLKTPIAQATKNKISENVKLKWQDPEYVAKWKLARAKTKCKRSASSKQVWQDPQVRAKAARSRAQQPKISSIQKILYDMLKSLGIEYAEESSQTVFGFYSFDCLIPHKKLLIEVQGDYWHSLEKNVKNDRSKFTYLKNYFPEYSIVYIWEHEFKNREALISKLRAICGLDQKTIDFDLRALEIKECEKRDVRGFLDAYHYIGGNKGGTAFGAFLGDELIACSLFSPPIRQNVCSKHNLRHDQVAELSRFCIHPLRHKKNLASWFLSKCISMLPKSIKLLITFADCSAGHQGTIYKALNFKYSHEVPPNYWYIDESDYVISKKRVYNHATKLGLKESEYAKQLGLAKKYGGSKSCFILYRH